MTKATSFTYAIGRRKSAVARVRLFKGKGESQVNSKRAEEIFPGKIFVKGIYLPFESTSTMGKYYFTARVTGGGTNSQLGAVQLGVARALVKENESLKSPLRKFDLLTRDSRERQRRMVGMGGKSRRKKQSPKR